MDQQHQQHQQHPHHHSQHPSHIQQTRVDPRKQALLEARFFGGSSKSSQEQSLNLDESGNGATGATLVAASSQHCSNNAGGGGMSAGSNSNVGNSVPLFRSMSTGGVQYHPHSHHQSLSAQPSSTPLQPLEQLPQHQMSNVVLPANLSPVKPHKDGAKRPRKGSGGSASKHIKHGKTSAKGKVAESTVSSPTHEYSTPDIRPSQHEKET